MTKDVGHRSHRTTRVARLAVGSLASLARNCDARRHRVRYAILILALPFFAACGGGSTASTATAGSPTSAAASSCTTVSTTANDPQPLDDCSTLARLVPLSTPGATPGANDRVQTFTALSGQTVQIVVQAPHPQQASTYFVPALASGPADAYFSNAIATARTGGYSNVVFPTAVYNFQGPWSADGLTDMSIDLQGSTLNFLTLGDGLVFSNATRLLMQNFTVDYPNALLAATGTIVTGQNSHHALQIDAQYPIAASSPPGILAVEMWDVTNNVFARPSTPDNFPSAADYTYGGSNTYASATGVFDAYAIGSKVLARFTNSGNVVNFIAGKHISLKNITVSYGPGFGFAFLGGDAAWLDRCSVTRSNGRLISTSQDAMNFSLHQGDIIVENGTFSYQGDDGFDAGGWIRPVISATNSSATIGMPAIANGNPSPMQVGDPVAFFDGSLNYLHEYTLTQDALSGVDDLVQFDAGGNALNSPAYAADLAQSGVRIYIAGNTFSYSHGRGILVENPYVMLSGNTFTGVTEAAILVDADASFFFNGMAAADMQIIGNRFTDTSSYDGAVWISAANGQGLVPNPVHQNIAIDQNQFSGTLGPAIQVNAAANVWIQGNTLTNTNQGSAGNYTVGSATTAGSIVVYGARNVGGTNTGSGTSGPVSVDVGSTQAVSVSVGP